MDILRYTRGGGGQPPLVRKIKLGGWACYKMTKSLVYPKIYFYMDYTHA